MTHPASPIPDGLVDGPAGLELSPSEMLELRRGADGFDESRIRLIARIAAEESMRLFRPGVALGQEAAVGAASTIQARSIDVDTESGNTVELGGPFRCIMVSAGGNASLTLRLWSYDGRTQDLAAVPGLYLADVPVLRAQLVVPAGLTGTVRFVWSLVPGAFGAPCCDVTTTSNVDDVLGVDHIQEYVDSGIGTGNTDVDVDAGFHYVLTGLSFTVVNDATVANRRSILSVRQSDGATEAYLIRHPDDTAASQTGYYIVGPGFSIQAAITISNESWAWRGVPFGARVPSGQATLTMFRGTVQTGQAGDVVTIVSTFTRRRIL